MQPLPAPLYEPRPYATPPSVAWDPSDFSNVDDTVRGGNSSSKMELVKSDSTSNEGQEGEIIFSGYLDTLTLGGAGFASQLYPKPLPFNVSNQDFKGLSLLVRAPRNSTESAASPPGGGKSPVSSFVLGFKTELPKKRPDGRNESSVIYEWDFQLPNSTSTQSSSNGLASIEQSDTFKFEREWKDFNPTYRGRPVDPRPEFIPQEIKEWSIMARSDFGAQSGPFSLQMISISALPSNSSISYAEKLSMRNADDLSNSAASSFKTGSSSEYYGFSLFIFVTLIWFLWFFWALIPEEGFQFLGIDWYPNREWAYLIPAWSMVLVLTTYAVFIALNLYHSVGAEELKSLVDSHSNILEVTPSSHYGQASSGPQSAANEGSFANVEQIPSKTQASSGLKSQGAGLHFESDSRSGLEPQSPSEQSSSHPLANVELSRTDELGSEILDLPNGMVSRRLYL